MLPRRGTKEPVIYISQLQQEMADPEVWNTLYGLLGAVERAAQFVQVQTSKPHNAGIQIHHGTVPADTSCQHWKRAMYLPFMNQLLQEMNIRL